jgi:glutaredoxin 3
MNITIFTKHGCPNCTTAKNLLASKGLGYIEMHDQTDEFEFEKMLKAHPTVRQLPQIFINDQRVGGLAGLQEALKLMGYV